MREEFRPINPSTIDPVDLDMPLHPPTISLAHTAVISLHARWGLAINDTFVDRLACWAVQACGDNADRTALNDWLETELRSWGYRPTAGQ